MEEDAGQRPEEVAGTAAPRRPDEIAQDAAAAVGAVADWLKKDVVAAAVQAAPDELKREVAAAAVAATPDELKGEAVAAAVGAAPDEIKQEVAATAVEAAPDQAKRVVAGVVEGVLAAKQVEDARYEKALAKALRTELHGPPLVDYKGLVGIDVVAADGRRVRVDQSGRITGMRGDSRYSLVVRVGAEVNASLAAPLRVSGAVSEPRVEFDVVLDSDDPRRRQPKRTVVVAATGGSADVSFPLEGPWEVTTRLWLRLSQRGQIIQSIELKVPRG